MSTTKRATQMGVAAFVLAAALILVAAFTGNLPGVQNINTTRTGTSSSSGVGSLSLLMTDPPVTPTGVTAVYISYSDVMVHVSGDGNQSGWYPVGLSGTINLLGTVNISQTLGTVKIASGEYNFLRFNITSASVTYNGANYTAFVPTAELNVPIVGGVQVNDSKPSATVIDLQSTVVNIGSHSDPEFIIRSVVVAYPVPPGEVTSSVQQQGYRFNLSGMGWWTRIRDNYSSSIQITSASLSGSSLTLTVENTGNQSTVLYFVTVTPQLTFLGGYGTSAHGHVTDSLLSSETLVVLANGTLSPLSNLGTLAQVAREGGKQSAEAYLALFGAPGYNLSAKASVTLTFNGSITIGFPTYDNGQPVSVTSGSAYTIAVLGTQTVATYTIDAT